jgi:DUF4097 and DUF4098 domain-containing protein YvlB
MPTLSTHRLALLPPLALLVALSAAHSAGAQRRTRFTSDDRSRIDTTFAFDKSGTVTVSATNGDVIVTGVAGNQIHVRASSDGANLRLDASPLRVMLEATGRRSDHDSHLEISVPYGTRIIARTQSGDIGVHGTRGEVEVHAQSGDIGVDDVVNRLDINTLSGDITVRNVAGDAVIATTSGSVKASEIRGNADVGTVSGDIDLRGVTAKVVRAKTTSGDVTFDGLIDPAGRYELVAHSGDVNLHIQREASAQLTVSTWNGGIDSQFPITLRPGEHGIGSSNSKKFTFEIGGGAARITAETFSGDVTISSNGRGASSPERRP